MSSKQPVLVYVEDDESSIFVMKMIVERVMGLKTLYILQSSEGFIRQVEGLNQSPDIFLLDIQMKPYNGFDLLSMLRNDPKYSESKIIALTASVMNEEVARLKKSGFDGAIAKPLNIDIFPDLIARIVGGESVWYIV